MQIRVEAVKSDREDVHVVAIVEERKGDGWNRLTARDIQTEGAENFGVITARDGQRIVLELTSVPKAGLTADQDAAVQQQVERQREANRRIKAGGSDEDSGAPLAPGAEMDTLSDEVIEARRQKALQAAKERQAQQGQAATTSNTVPGGSVHVSPQQGTPAPGPGVNQAGAKPAGQPATNVVGARSSKEV